MFLGQNFANKLGFLFTFFFAAASDLVLGLVYYYFCGFQNKTLELWQRNNDADNNVKQTIGLTETSSSRKSHKKD